ncbi:MAG: bacterioferritin [Chromatiales bacterium]|nr:bacterioferritin [Chromatiales bacterium]
MKNKDIIEIMNKILEHELAGVVRYTHYSLMVYGYNRIPVVSWLRAQATESLTHAQQVGEHITTLGGHPSLKISPLLETHKHTIEDILKESLEHEQQQLALYYALLKKAQDQIIWLEDFSRNLILEEEQHISEVEKMLRPPGH